MAVTVTLIGKPECHLCDDAREVIIGVIDDLDDIAFEEVHLDDNPLWGELYGELIPVVLINGAEHTHWRVESNALTQALRDAVGQSG